MRILGIKAAADRTVMPAEFALNQKSKINPPEHKDARFSVDTTTFKTVKIKNPDGDNALKTTVGSA